MDELMRDVGVNTYEELISYMLRNPEDDRVKELTEMMSMFGVKLPEEEPQDVCETKEEMYNNISKFGMSGVMASLGVENKKELYDYMKAHQGENAVKWLEELLEGGFGREEN